MSVVEGDGLITSIGIEYDWWRVGKPLPKHLLQRGLIQSGNVGLGDCCRPRRCRIERRI
ncbi:MAG: hypothetical protein V4749_05470 [Pseudomonadota bacterium]